MIGKIKKGITIAKKIGAKRNPSKIVGGSRTGAFTKAQKEYAVDTLGADQVKQMMKEGFTKEQILIKAKKSGGPFGGKFGGKERAEFDRRARDIAEGGMRNPTSPGLKFKKGGAAMMYKKGYAAGGAAMKKKLFAPGGVTSSYDLADKMYPGGSRTKSAPTKTRAKKKPVVTKAMMTKAGATSLRDFYNKMEVNAAGTGYKKRSKALTRRKPKKSIMGQENPKLKFGTESRSGTTVKPKKSTMSQENPKLKFGTRSKSGTTVKPKKRKAGPMGNPFGLVSAYSVLFGKKRDARLKRDEARIKRIKQARKNKKDK